MYLQGAQMDCARILTLTVALAVHINDTSSRASASFEFWAQFDNSILKSIYYCNSIRYIHCSTRVVTTTAVS